jgi:energy-coupling factor transporter ATP-binding protein EcfA2
MPITRINYDKVNPKIEARYKKLDEALPIPPVRMLISGSSGSGKSTLLLNLMNKDNGYGSVYKKPHIILFSGTYGLDKKLLKNLDLDQSNVFKDFDESVIMDVFSQQKGIFDYHGEEKLDDVLIIFEDLASQNVFKNDRTFKKLAYEGRHLRISFIILTQKYNDIPTSIRRNCNCFIILKPANYQEYDIIVDETVDKRRKDKFSKMLDYVFAEPYAFLIIYNINNRERFRKNFDTALDINQF